MKINLLKSSFLLVCLFLVNVAFAQTRVTGVVTDDQGDPIIGANVIIKGTTQGVTTGVMGDFSIAAPADATLQVSYIGFETQDIPVANRTKIDVQLKSDALELEEVVVVGYGTQKKVNLTGAVSAVNVDETLTNRAVSNLSAGMAGLIPGLTATQSSGMAGNDNATLRIRGMGTVNNSDPLVVVDGMPDVDINRINMNDVESISVLKDAAASAIYGSRAANGVILITTRSGKSDKGTTRINFSGIATMEKPTGLVEFIPDYALQMHIAQKSMLASNTPTSSSIYYQDDAIDQWMAMAMIDPLKFPSTDWWKAIARTGYSQNYNVSASGSNDMSSFFMSAGLRDRKGIQRYNDYQLYTARFNYEAKIRKNMNAGARFSGSWSKMTRSNLSRGFTDGTDAGGDYRYAIAGIVPYDPETGYFGGTMMSGEDPQAYNPYVGMVTNPYRANNQQMTASMYWNWTPVKGLRAAVDYALTYKNWFSKTAGIPTQAYNFRDEVFATRWYVNKNAGVSNTSNTEYKTRFNVSLNYNATFNDIHDLSVLAVYEEEYEYWRQLGASRDDRYHPSLSEINSALTKTVSNNGSSRTEGLRSFIGRINYGLMNGRYLVEANIRIDGSSRFAPGRQYGYFPSGSVGWRFSDENFVKSWAGNWLTNGKLRASYGSLGNNTLGTSRSSKLYDQQNLLDVQNYMIGGSQVLGFVYKRMDNDRLSWEKTTVFNVGLDLGFLRNRLTATIDYYNKLTTGMIRTDDFSILLTGAYDAPSVNIGNLRNNGIEANVSWQDRAGDWTYSASVNFAYNRTILEKWNTYLGRGWEFIGMPYHFAYSWNSTGIMQTYQDIYNYVPQPAKRPGDIMRIDKSGNGSIGGEDKVAHPNRYRKIFPTTYSFQGSVAWKGIDLFFMFQGSAGRWDFTTTNWNISNPGQRMAITEGMVNNPWSLENRNGKWPARNATNSRDEMDFWLENASFLRLKNVQLGYTLPKRWLSKVGISNLRVYLSGENLATFTNFSLMDPENTDKNNDVYPLTKSFSIGLNLSF